MKFHILGSRLVVKPRTPHFSSIIAKPETVMDEYSEDGEIVQAGPGCADFLEEGMHVCYHQGAGEVMKVDGEKVLILNAGDVRAYYETELADVAPI
jgi:co-chaperonin GroES (HSP10)